MKQLTVKDLVEKLNYYKENIVELCFEGTISMNIEFKINKISNEKNHLIFYDNYNKKISLNNHQIMKIVILENEIVLIKFDSFQTLRILF